jgi:hypothetical protein
MLPLINSRKIDLLDHPKLINQLCGLERRTARGGRDSIDHAPGSHDDIANSIAGLAATAGGKYRYPSSLDWVSGPVPEEPEAAKAAAAKAFQEARLASHIMRGSYRRY